MTVALALGALGVLAVVAFYVTGGHLYDVRTASMGTSAPPGSLVATRPVRFADIHPGRVITFHPPTSPAQTYTHRVVAVDAAGVVTRGDVNAVADPWRIGPGDVVGVVVTIVPGAGYALRLVPILAIGGLVVVALSRWRVRHEYRPAANLLGLVLVVAFALLRVQPFVSVHALQTVTDGDGARFKIVSTGVLPVGITSVADHGTAVPTFFIYGAVKDVVVTGKPAGGHYLLTTKLHLTRLQWLLLFGFWLAPFFVSVLVTWRPTDEHDIGPMLATT